VDVPQNITANVVNSATVSGGGDPNSHTANDPTHIGPPVEINDPGDLHLRVTAGGAASTSFVVNSEPGEGTVNFSCSGLPAQASSSFTPPFTNASATAVTLLINTSQTMASATPVEAGGTRQLYAVLFPLFLMIGLGFGARKSGKMRLRLVILAAGVFLSLSLLSCGGQRQMTVSSSSSFSVVVTATSATTGHSGSMTIDLTVIKSDGQSH